MSDENNKTDNAPPAPDLGGLQIPSGTPTGSDPTAVSGSASAEVIRQRKQRSDAGKTRGSRTPSTGGSIPPLSQTQFAALYDPKLWGKALSAPGDGMAAITGKKYWEISTEERDALGATGSIAAQCFAVTDPRWLAVSLALITVLDVYGMRLAIHFADRKKEQEAEEKKKRDT